MRIIKSGDQAISIKASNLAYTLFRQEFNADLPDELAHIEAAAQQRAALESVSKIDNNTISVLMDVGRGESDNALEVLGGSGIMDNPEALAGLLAIANGGASESLPVLSIMKTVWAMNAAAKFGTPIQAFDQWVTEYDDFDFVNTFPDIYAEIKRGFFRSGNTE